MWNVRFYILVWCMEKHTSYILHVYGMWKMEDGRSVYTLIIHVLTDFTQLFITFTVRASVSYFVCLPIMTGCQKGRALQYPFISFYNENENLTYI